MQWIPAPPMRAEIDQITGGAVVTDVIHNKAIGYRTDEGFVGQSVYVFVLTLATPPVD